MVSGQNVVVSSLSVLPQPLTAAGRFDSRYWLQ
jgi:hypothetical protein